MNPKVAESIQLISARTAELKLTRQEHMQLSQAIQTIILELSNTKTEAPDKQLPNESTVKKAPLKANGRVGRKRKQALRETSGEKPLPSTTS